MCKCAVTLHKYKLFAIALWTVKRNIELIYVIYKIPSIMRHNIRINEKITNNV